MCTEKDPLNCHRAILIARELVEIGADIVHVLENGQLETHDMMMKCLLKGFGLLEQDMFRATEDMYKQADAAQEKQIAYTGGAP